MERRPLSCHVRKASCRRATASLWVKKEETGGERGTLCVCVCLTQALVSALQGSPSSYMWGQENCVSLVTTESSSLGPTSPSPPLPDRTSGLMVLAQGCGGWPGGMLSVSIHSLQNHHRVANVPCRYGMLNCSLDVGHLECI